MQTGTYKLNYEKTVTLQHCSFTLEKDSLVKVEAVDRWSGKALIIFDDNTSDWFHPEWLLDIAELLPLCTRSI